MKTAAAISRNAGAASRRLFARAVAGRKLDMTVEGLEHVPTSGPALLVARHYHHLYDGVALLAAIPREVHFLVAMDWVPSGPFRRVMEGLTAAARWPAVWRPGAPPDLPGVRHARLHQARDLSLQLLREGKLLTVFPEGYPVIAPEGNRRADLLPFESGFASLAISASRDGSRIPIIPVGLSYQMLPTGLWSLHLRLGPPVYAGKRDGRDALVQLLQAQVAALSS